MRATALAAASLAWIAGAAGQSAIPDRGIGALLFECRFATGILNVEGPIAYYFNVTQNKVYLVRLGSHILASTSILIGFEVGERSISFRHPVHGSEFATVITAGSDFGRARITRHFVYADNGAGMAFSTSEGQCRYSNQVRLPSRGSGIDYR